MKWNILANDDSITRTIDALKQNGIDAFVVASGEEAKNKIAEMLPKKAEVMQMTSITLDAIGVSKMINESGDYESIRNRLYKLDRRTQSLEMQKLGSTPEWTVGSVHAITEKGEVVVASNTGSQL